MELLIPHIDIHLLLKINKFFQLRRTTWSSWEGSNFLEVAHIPLKRIERHLNVALMIAPSVKTVVIEYSCPLFLLKKKKTKVKVKVKVKAYHMRLGVFSKNPYNSPHQILQISELGTLLWLNCRRDHIMHDSFPKSMSAGPICDTKRMI